MINKMKKEDWYKQQKQSRIDLIQSSPYFCCKISKELLDVNDSFIMTKNGLYRIVSQKGLEMILKQNPENINAIYKGL